VGKSAWLDDIGWRDAFFSVSFCWKFTAAGAAGVVGCAAGVPGAVKRTHRRGRWLKAGANEGADRQKGDQEVDEKASFLWLVLCLGGQQKED